MKRRIFRRNCSLIAVFQAYSRIVYEKVLFSVAILNGPKFESHMPKAKCGLFDLARPRPQPNIRG
jgi:hypothetical protein